MLDLRCARRPGVPPHMARWPRRWGRNLREGQDIGAATGKLTRPVGGFHGSTHGRFQPSAASVARTGHGPALLSAFRLAWPRHTRFGIQGQTQAAADSVRGRAPGLKPLS